MRALFVCIYFAGPRPAEAVGLREQDCKPPVAGWGLVTLRNTRPQANKRSTDSGKAHDDQGLKHRDEESERPVPIPRELVITIREHIDMFGTAENGRLFFTSTGATSPALRARRSGNRHGHSH